MPSGKIHKQRSAFITLPGHSLLINDKEDNNLQNKILELLSTITGTRVSSTLPDKFEPAFHPNHRSSFHSPVFGLIVIKLGLDALQNLKQYRDMRKVSGIEQVSLQELLNIFLVGASVGYLDHLIADGFTPKGLPLFQ